MVCKILKQKVCEFTTFLPGIECGLALSNVKCFLKAQITGIVFARNNLDLNAFIVFVLAGIDMFFHRVFIIEMFFYAWLFAWVMNSNFPFLFFFLFLSVCLFVIFAVLYDNKFAIRSILSWFDQFKICKMVGNRPLRAFGFRIPGNCCSKCNPESSKFFLWNPKLNPGLWNSNYSSSNPESY